MRGFAVALNGKHVATFSLEGLNVAAVRASGDVISTEFGCLEASGGRYGESEEDKHLIWIDDMQLSSGDEIAVTFLADAVETVQGHTIEELYPEGEQPTGPTQPVDEISKELRKRPRQREGFTFEVTPPNGSPIDSRTTPDDFSFGFTVLWNWKNPERCRVSLSSNSLENIVRRTGGNDHASFTLQLGECVHFRIAS